MRSSLFEKTALEELAFCSLEYVDGARNKNHSCRHGSLSMTNGVRVRRYERMTSLTFFPVAPLAIALLLYLFHPAI
jgi:hypothetical protein